MNAADRYRKFILDRPGPRHTVYLNHFRFWINPTSFDYRKEPIHVDVPTRAGYGRFYYGTKPPTITLDGHTGTAGLDELRKMEEAFSPLIGKEEELIPFKYPVRLGESVLWVYVNVFEDKIADSMHLYNQYHFELIQYPYPHPQTAMPIDHEGIDIGVPKRGS